MANPLTLPARVDKTIYGVLALPSGAALVYVRLAAGTIVPLNIMDSIWEAYEAEKRYRAARENVKEMGFRC